MKKTSLSLFILCIVCNTVFSQTSPSVIFITKTGDSVKCLKYSWGRKYDYIKCNDEKMEMETVFKTYKTMLVGEVIWRIVPMDIDKPNDKQEFRLANVPKIFYSDTVKIAVSILFKKVVDHGTPKDPKLEITYEFIPSSFEFIKKQIEHDLDSLKIKHVVIYNNKFPHSNRIGGSYHTEPDKEIVKNGANIVMEFEFTDYPRENKAEKSKATLNDFANVILTIDDVETTTKYTYNGKEYRKWKDIQYLSLMENKRDSNSTIFKKYKINYSKTWRQFLIDYENSKPK